MLDVWLGWLSELMNMDNTHNSPGVLQAIGADI